MQNEMITPTSITFDYGKNKSGTAISNSAGILDIESVTFEKFCLSHEYFLGDKITYIIDIKNNSDIPLFNIKIKENMGKSETEDTSNTLSPLKYANAFRYYINGNSSELKEPKVYSDKVIFEIDVLPALSSVSIIYSAEITDAAPLAKKSMITNCSSMIIPSMGKTLEFSNTINVKEIADIKTIKQIKKLSINDITYGILIYNYGNTPAKNVIIKDKIENNFSNIEIKIGSKPINIPDYSISANNIQIPSYGSNYSVSVPEAKFIKNRISGKFEITPGIVEVIVNCKV